MITLKNEIVINATIDKIWKELATLNRLELFDPAVKASNVLTTYTSGEGAKRRIEMYDGKNWFEETCTIYKENTALTFELNACSFPVHNLAHSYEFVKIEDNRYKVIQTQRFTMKYGFVGKIMGSLIQSKWNKGIKDFLQGLKTITEKN